MEIIRFLGFGKVNDNCLILNWYLRKSQRRIVILANFNRAISALTNNKKLPIISHWRNVKLRLKLKVSVFYSSKLFCLICFKC